MRRWKAWLRNGVLAALAGGAVLLLAFGPRRAGGEGGRAGDVVIVDYWEKWTGVEAQQMQAVVDEFNQTVGAQKRIYVRYVSTSQIAEKTLVATAAGVPPDISGVWDNTLPQLVALDAIEPLDDLAREHGIGPSLYKRVYWDACVFEGRLMALVSTPWNVALHINKALVAEYAGELRAAGLDPEGAPATVEELDAWARVMTEQDSNGGLIRAGYLPMEPGWWIVFTPLWFGGSLYDEEARRFTLTDPQVVRAFEWVRSYSRWLGQEAVADFRSGLGNFDSPQNAFLAGQAVMVQQGPWMANYIRRSNPQMSGVRESLDDEIKRPLSERLERYQWKAAAFPSAVPGLENVTYCGFDALVIPRGARHPREAFEFIAFVQRQSVQEQLTMAHCKNSVLAEVSEQFLNHHPNPYIRVFEMLATSPNARSCPHVPIYGLMHKELDNLVQRIAMLQVDPATGLAATQARLQAALDQFDHRQQLRRNGGPTP